jgi:hypothetical protein
MSVMATKHSLLPARSNAMTSNEPPIRSPQFQRGYLIEIPIMLIILVVVLAVLMPRLPLNGQKALIGVAAVPILFFLLYMIVAPGWMPRGTSGRAVRLLRVALFLACAAAIVAGAGAFILR